MNQKITAPIHFLMGKTVCRIAQKKSMAESKNAAYKTTMPHKSVPA